MFGAIIGDLVGFPYEYKHEDLTDKSIPLFGGNRSGAGSAGGNAQAGEDFSDKTVLTAAVEAGILQFERKLPSIMAGTAETADADRSGVRQQPGQASAVNVSVGGRMHRARIFRRTPSRRIIKKSWRQLFAASAGLILWPDTRWISVSGFFVKALRQKQRMRVRRPGSVRWHGPSRMICI